MKHNRILAFCVATLVGGSIFTMLAHDRQSEAYDYADSLIVQMTLEEKIPLMMYSSPSVERLGISAYNWWNEALHGVARAGYATVFPQAIGMAATFNPALVEQVFTVVSTEGRAKFNAARATKGSPDQYEGLTYWTPNINIFRDPRWGRGQETYGEDPWLTSQMGVAAVRGIQGPLTECRQRKATACAKHFAVHSGPEWNRHSFDASDVNPRDLRETYLPAFKALVDAGVGQVMCAYNRLYGEPCCSNQRLLSRILREEWGYKGIVVSDCWAIDDFFMPGRHETYEDAPTAAGAALSNGTDMECGSAYWSLNEAIQQGAVDEQHIDTSLRLTLAERYRLGELNHAATPWDDIALDTINCATHRTLALEVARQSIVLLKNDGILPLSADARIAVIGPNAADSIMPLGNYNGTPYHTVTILDALRKLFGDIEYIKGCEYVGDTFDYDLPVAETVIFVGGISPALEGEQMDVPYPGFNGGDRTTIELPEVQRQLVKYLVDNGKKVIFVNCSGSAVALAQEDSICSAMVQLWYPGESGGTALAEMLTGAYEPTGRLPITFYSSDDQLPDYENYDMIRRTYRYMTAKPLYQFGYGLGYARLEYGVPQLSENQINNDGSVAVTVAVSNASADREGKAVVQVYIRKVDDIAGPQKTLRGIAIAKVAPASTTQVTITLKPEDLQTYDAVSGQMRVCPGRYQIFAGESSATLKSAQLNILP